MQPTVKQFQAAVLINGLWRECLNGESAVIPVERCPTEETVAEIIATACQQGDRQSR